MSLFLFSCGVAKITSYLLSRTRTTFWRKPFEIFCLKKPMTGSQKTLLHFAQFKFVRRHFRPPGKCNTDLLGRNLEEGAQAAEGDVVVEPRGGQQVVLNNSVLQDGRPVRRSRLYRQTSSLLFFQNKIPSYSIIISRICIETLRFTVSQ